MNVTQTPTSATTSTGSSGAASSSSASASAANPLGEQQFLQLLTAQLANQDPLNPMDDTTFVAQLAQFASVEQLTTANSNLESLLVSQTSNNQTSDANLIGKSVLFSSSSVAVGSTGGATLYANLSAPAAQLTAVVTDSSGKTVRTLQLGNEPSGDIQVPWDGMDDQGNPVSPGTYNVSITATDASGNPVTVKQEELGLVTGVNFANGYAELVVNGQEINLSNVVEIDSAPPSP